MRAHGQVIHTLIHSQVYPQTYPQPCGNQNPDHGDKRGMNITTTHASFTTLLRPDCSDSQAVRYVSVIIRDNTENIGVIVQWANGDEWTYLVPLAVVLANLGEDSVGRFANAMKREAVFTMAKREAVGV